MYRRRLLLETSGYSFQYLMGILKTASTTEVLPWLGKIGLAYSCPLPSLPRKGIGFPLAPLPFQARMGVPRLVGWRWGLGLICQPPPRYAIIPPTMHMTHSSAFDFQNCSLSISPHQTLDLKKPKGLDFLSATRLEEASRFIIHIHYPCLTCTPLAIRQRKKICRVRVFLCKIE